ncbi:MAG: hypothetical protein LBC09_07020, partial [Helicobacteraceae bacterium]|nr:hypothetical protein [Helicobacteraceae bacterium]
MFSCSGFALRASLFSRYAPIALAVFLIGCGGGGSSDDTPPIVYGEDCSKISTVSDGAGGYEAYDHFLPFDSTGATVKNTKSLASYEIISDDKADELRKHLSEQDFADISGDQGTDYQKCNAEPGMHAEVVFGDESDEYKLVLSLYGNGAFVPNLAKFQEVFGDIGELPSSFYVSRIYNQDMTTKFKKYISDAETNKYICNDINCIEFNPYRLFQVFYPDWIYWNVD